MHFGTSLWDTAAPEALVRTSGGRVSDLFGAPLVHRTGGPLKNALGVVASAKGCGAAHASLTKAMRSDPRALALLAESAGPREAWGAQAADVARGLDGRPLCRRWLGEAVGGGALLRYDAPEAGAFRGMMSNGCRLDLVWGEGGGEGEGAADSNGAEGGNGRVRPRSAFYKRVVMGELDAARDKAREQPAKLARDARSFRVEAGFLGSAACAQLLAAGVHAPRAYYVDMRPDEASPIDSAFAMLLSDFSPEAGWSQVGLLDAGQARRSLASLARLHAFFWEGGAFSTRGGEAAAELEAAVWPAGMYTQPSMQPAAQFDRLAEKYTEHSERLGPRFHAAEELAGVDSEQLQTLGQRLQRVARDAAAEAHPFDDAAAGAGGAGSAGSDAARRFRTLIHGDPKAANLLLHEGGAVGFIDFQWTGWGLAATDVAHHVCAALAPAALAQEGALLDHYHASLLAAAAEFGGAPSMPSRAQFQAQYVAAILDMGRIVLAYQWSRADFETPSLNRNGYNKDARCAAWLAARCDRALAEWERGRALG
mmetsp:Transcript_11596/g.38692  ORF Transcript_11596/g.38692 Transcript_11596/m.38692 type:complete len:538 (-) Transcript_11596:158-1771(-)